MAVPTFQFDLQLVAAHEQTKVDFQDVRATYHLEQDLLDYISAIENDLPKILTGSRDELRVIKNKLIKKLDFKKVRCLAPGRANCLKCVNCLENQLKKDFSIAIQKAFGYSSDVIAPYFYGLNNKACYICNAQYTIFAYANDLNIPHVKVPGTFQAPNGNFIVQKRDIAKFQFDHYFPKSLYPAFSLSLHNLVPICASCNLVKLNNEYDLEDLYDNLKYSVEEGSIVDYYNNNGLLKITLEDKTKDKIGSKFDLKGIYDNHTDIVEEVLARKVKYTKRYKSGLAKKFTGIVISDKVIDDRLILGMYAKTDGFDKRPLSKFIHDINDQLDKYQP